MNSEQNTEKQQTNEHIPAGRPVNETNEGPTNPPISKDGKVTPRIDSDLNEDNINKSASLASKNCFTEEDLKAIIPDSELLRIIGSSVDPNSSVNKLDDDTAYAAHLQPLLYFTPENLIRSFQNTLDFNPQRYKNDLVQGATIVLESASQREQSYHDNHPAYIPNNPYNNNAPTTGPNAAYSGEGALHRHFRHKVNLNILFNNGEEEDDIDVPTLWDDLAFYDNGYPSYATKTLEQYQEILENNPEQWYEKTKERFHVAPLQLWYLIAQNYKIKTRICFIRENLIKLFSTLPTQLKMEYRSGELEKRKRLFFIDRGILSSEQGIELLKLATDKQTLIFPEVHTKYEVLQYLTYVVEYMIKAEHEADFLVVFPRWTYDFEENKRISSFTYCTKSPLPIKQYIGGKINGVLTWMNIVSNILGIWGGNAPAADIVDVDDGKSELLIIQHVTNGLHGAYDQDIIQYGYDEDHNYSTWFRVGAAIAGALVPEYSFIIGAVSEVLNSIVSGSKYHSHSFNWWIYPVRPLNLTMNVQDWMTLVDFFNEVGAQIDYPDGRTWLPSYKTTTDCIFSPGTHPGTQFRGFPVKIPICSRFVRIGYGEKLIEYVNATRVTLANIGGGDFRLGHAITARGYIKDVMRRIFIQNCFGSLYNNIWMTESYSSNLRLAFDVCSNYSLIPTKAYASVKDYMWFDTQVHSTLPGVMERWSIPIAPVLNRDLHVYWKGEYCQPAGITDETGSNVFVLEETFVPEIEWNKEMYGEFNDSRTTPTFWQDFEMHQAADDQSYYVWNETYVGTINWNMAIQGNNGQLRNTNSTSVVGLCHYCRNGCARIFIPYILHEISTKFTLHLRSIDPDGAALINNDAGHHACTAIRYRAAKGSDSAAKFRVGTKSFVFKQR
jgi:hypothetical protein